MDIYIYVYIYIYMYIVCGHEITQAMLFAETSFWHSFINRNLSSKLFTIFYGTLLNF